MTIAALSKYVPASTPALRKMPGNRVAATL